MWDQYLRVPDSLVVSCPWLAARCPLRCAITPPPLRTRQGKYDKKLMDQEKDREITSSITDIGKTGSPWGN